MTAHLEAENAYTQAADRAPGRPAPDDLRGDQGADPRDRPVGADPQPRLLVLRPLLRGQGVRRQLPGPGDRPRRLDAAAARRGLRARPARAARRGAAARPRRPGRGPRVLLARRLERQPGRHPARLLDRRGRRRALHDPGPRPGHRASTVPTRSSASSAAPPGTASGEHLYYTTVDESWRSDKIWRHTLGTTQADDELVHHEDGRPVLRRRRPQPQRPVRHHRGRVQDHLGVPLPRRRRPRCRLPGVRRASGGSGVLPRPRGHRRRGRLPRAAQRTPARTSRSAPRPSRPPRPRTGRPLVPHDPAVRLEDVDAFAGHLVVHQRSARADPAPHPRARRRRR